MKKGSQKKDRFNSSVISDDNLAHSMCRHFPEVVAEALLFSHSIAEVKVAMKKSYVRKAVDLGWVKKKKDPALFAITKLGSEFIQ